MCNFNWPSSHRHAQQALRVHPTPHNDIIGFRCNYCHKLHDFMDDGALLASRDNYCNWRQRASPRPFCSRMLGIWNHLPIACKYHEYHFTTRYYYNSNQTSPAHEVIKGASKPVISRFSSFNDVLQSYDSGHRLQLASIAPAEPALVILVRFAQSAVCTTHSAFAKEYQ